MAKPIEIKRTQAANFITSIVEYIGAVKDDALVDKEAVIRNITARLELLDIPVAIRCPGEAHLPEVAGNIDHCSVCAPNWGWVIPSIKVK